MGVMTVEGVVDHGEIKLKKKLSLPDHTKVYIVVPDIQVEQVVHVATPRLANPEKAADFKMEVIEKP